MTRDQREIAAVRAQGFKGYDKTLHSKCRKPEVYGIRRTAAAQEAIDRYANRAPKRDNRKLSERITCRMTKDERALLQRAYTASGSRTMQDYVRTVLMESIKERLEKESGPTDA